MSTLNCIDVSLRPGAHTIVRLAFSSPIAEPAILLESPLAYRLRSVLVTSLQVNDVEQLAVSELPAALLESPDARLLIEPLRTPRDVLSVQFANPVGAPAAAFRIWAGSREHVRRLSYPLPVCWKAPEGEWRHAWAVEPSSFSRCNRCAQCGAYWVAEGV